MHLRELALSIGKHRFSSYPKKALACLKDIEVRRTEKCHKITGRSGGRDVSQDHPSKISWLKLVTSLSKASKAIETGLNLKGLAFFLPGFSYESNVKSSLKFSIVYVGLISSITGFSSRLIHTD